MTMENIQLKQAEINKTIIKPKYVRAMEDNLRGIHTKTYFKRIYEGKKNYWGSQHSGYYCYDCKGDFVFYQENPRRSAENNPPFKFHRVFIENKTRLNEYGNYTTYEYYKALCCKCWDKWVNSFDKETKPSPDCINCDCQQWISQETEKTHKEIKAYKDMVRQSEILKICVDKLGQERFNESYLLSRVNNIIKEEDTQNTYYKECIRDKKNYFNLLNKWEIESKL
jgi:hypothetical protein